jgi:diacylglycerol kinase (ATP)
MSNRLLEEKKMATPPRNGTGLGRVGKALSVSLAGLASVFRSEAAFRQELMIGVPLAAIALVVDVSGFERALLIASILLVLIVELLNSAIETTLDRITRDHDASVKKAKDMGSAAVFLSLLTAGAVWLFVMGPHVARWVF